MRKYFEKLYKESSNEFHNLVKENLLNNNKMFIVTANPETLMIAEKNSEFKTALLDNHTTIVPDGIGVVKGAKMLDLPAKETITGVDLCSKLFEYCNEFKKSIFLFGAKEDVVKKLTEVITTNYPNLTICGYDNGYVEDKQNVFDKIAVLQPDVILVALGIPHQELLIYNNLNKFQKGIFVGVGGSFDVLSGTKKRAPKLFIKLHLEWLYRILREPKRLKRFVKSNLMYLLKIKNVNFMDLLFAFALIFIFGFNFIKAIFFPTNINYYENRYNYKVTNVSILKFFDKSFQDNFELALSDQILFSARMKKVYNISNNYTIKRISDVIFKNSNFQEYRLLNNGIYLFGNENNLIYGPKYLDYNRDSFDLRTKNINEAITAVSSANSYLYYIEKDTDINFTKNSKSDVKSYLENNINISRENFKTFEINSFDEFKDLFYRTDHHWNYKGSYMAYTQLVDLLVPNDVPISHAEAILVGNNFSGSKSNTTGLGSLYSEPFYAYKFDLPKHDTYINGQASTYGHQNEFFNNSYTGIISYAAFYGSDKGEIIFDYHDNSKDNILIFGESYDNAVLELLASHFNRTFSIDLRNYEREMGKTFNLTEYIRNNNINKILFIGSMEFYYSEDFNLEV